MNVKVGKLKTHLSRYLKERQKSEAICANTMRRTFEHDGLHVSQWGRKTNTPLPPIGGTPVEGNAVVEMRASREW